MIDRNKIIDYVLNKSKRIMTQKDRDDIKKRAQNTPYLDKLIKLP